MSQSLPRVTFFLFAYNQADFIRDACEAALAQTYTPLEVILSDDCSSDETFQIMQDVVASYSGPHQVRLNRNDQNLGLIGHVNRAMEITESDLIVVAAGDDISLPERTEVIVKSYLEKKGQVFSIHSAVTKIDVQGNELDVWVPPLTESQPSPFAIATALSLVIGATHAWTRDTFRVFGPIMHTHAYEDLVIAYRSALLGGIHYIDQPLVKYRVGNGGLSTAAWEPVKNKEERLCRLIKGLKVSVDVLAQRRDDALRLEQNELAAILDRTILDKKISLHVYEKTRSYFSTLILAIKCRCFRSFRKAYWRVLRGVV